MCADNKLFINKGGLLAELKDIYTQIKKQGSIFQWLKLFVDDYETSKHLKNYEPKSDIAIIEPNNYHGETIPSVMKYFNDLGFCCDVFVPPKVFESGPLCAYANKSNNIYKTSFYLIKKLWNKQQFFNKYKYVFFNSINKEYVSDFLNIKMDNVLGYAHTSAFKPMRKLLENDKFFVLNEQVSNELDVSLLVPLFLGDVNKQQSSEIAFVVIGNITRTRKDFDLLLDSLKELKDNEIKSFKIISIGNEERPKYAKRIKKTAAKFNLNIEFKGGLSFEDMFEICAQADYILPLINPNIREHKFYLESGVTGTQQLIYALGLIPVINDIVADNYSFGEDKAIIYEGENLSSGILKAIEQKDLTRTKMRQALNDRKEYLYNKSLKNLKKALGLIKV